MPDEWRTGKRGRSEKGNRRRTRTSERGNRRRTSISERGKEKNVKKNEKKNSKDVITSLQTHHKDVNRTDFNTETSSKSLQLKSCQPNSQKRK